ncbi:MAG: methyltransferase domain-containing protein [Bacteroidota bacterium]
MFNNIITPYDFVLLYEKIRRYGIARIYSKLTKNNEERVKLSWAHTSELSSNWWDIPEVNRRWNLLITGFPDIDHYRYVSDKYLNTDRCLTGLSLGCGSGNRELQWVLACEKLKLFCYDISKERIKQARTNAGIANLSSRLSFDVGDVRAVDLGFKKHDVVIIEGALHHFYSIDTVLDKVRKGLKDEGVFIANEYVGPSRFQWTDSQLDGANRVLQMIPGEYRRKYFDGRIKKSVHRPGKLSMFLNDPSESAESSLIEGAIARQFKILERKEYGGTLLQLVFKDIAHNFTNERDETKELLKSIFSIEDEMLRKGEIKSDFVFYVCKN